MREKGKWETLQDCDYYTDRHSPLEELLPVEDVTVDAVAAEEGHLAGVVGQEPVLVDGHVLAEDAAAVPGPEALFDRQLQLMEADVMAL